MKKQSLFQALGLVAVGISFSLALTGLTAPSAQAETALTVYTTTASEDLKLYRKRFNKVHPDI